MGRIITLSVAVLMTIGGTGVVLSETVKQTSWGGTTKAHNASAKRRNHRYGPLGDGLCSP